MLFNRQGLQQKNWRMVKKGKHILFGCSLFFVVGGVSVNGPQVTYANETNSSELSVKQDNLSNKNTAVSTSELNTEKQTESLNDTTLEKSTLSESKEKSIPKKEVNKEELKNLVDKIKKTDISKKTEESVKKLNLVLIRAEKALDNTEITQEEIDNEAKALKEVFDKLEDKSEREQASEFKEKVESKKDNKVNFDKDIREKQQENKTEDAARKHNEKIAKVEAVMKEINSLASEIDYEFGDSEKELVNTIEKLPTIDNNSEESIQKLLNEAIYLRNRVANRVTRAHSGKRDPRNGKPIDGKGESGFRGVIYTHKENRRDGNLIENGNTAVYYNSDEIWSLIEIKGERVGNERKFTTYSRGKVVEDVTPYYIVTVGFTENSPIKGLKMQVAYWDKKAGAQRRREIEYGRTEINNPITNAAIRGVVGAGAIVQPGRYEVHIASNTRVAPNQLKPYTFTFIIKPQSERNMVKDLSQTYVDDVRHLTETEKTALIEKFKTEHPDVMTPSGHKSDFERAEIAADGSTMTIHFKDGFNSKTIQTNAQNDVEAKHSSLTTLVGDPHEFYKNPRNLVKSKTNHEVPQTARVTWKTPFDLSQPGTKNAVVTVSYDNGVTKDVTTPYTVLDFIGKQDKSIFQNQSGELGDARSYITLSNGTAPATDLTIRWKGGSSVDTSAQGTQRKEIEILRGNTVMKTVTIPVAIVDNINPIITAPDSVLLTRAEGLPSNISIDAQDNARGIGLKDANPIVVENLVNPLRYNPSTKRIELSGVIPNNFQRTQATIKAVDKNGNIATKTITFNVQAQTDKYNAVANPQKQTVSYGSTPDAGTSINKNGLPAGTTYAWATTPSTITGPGEKAGVVTVTYPDTSKDTVNVTIAVRKLSDEHVPTGTKIVRNQNVAVTNNDLKAAVNVNNNGNSKIKSVTPVGTISTINAGTQTINATVTYLDDTTDPVTIPLEVKDVTAPTIQTPSDRQNWDLIALDRTLPSIRVAATDNPGGSGVKTTTVTGLPDFLVYDDTTKTIKFKNGVQEVTKLPVGQNSKTYNATIQVTDNANNPSQRQVTITVKSMTTKYNATPNGQKQTVSYGVTPDAGTSINKNGLPAGTRYTWATTPSTTTGPGDKVGVVTVTYPDDSIDTVNVTVNVRALNGEYEPTATKITKNQNDSVSNDELKAAVTINNNGNNKVKSVTPVGIISTASAGTTTIKATVTFKDGTTKDVTIPLKVKDVTNPTIQSPTNGQNWDLIAVEGQDPNIAVTSEDNAGGSGVKATTVTGLPDFLAYDEATKTIKFKAGVTQVPSLPEGTDVQPHNVTIEVEDNAGNKTSAQVTITVKSMTTKYDATPNSEKQTVSYGATPDAGVSIDKSGLPTGTTYTWATVPSTTDGPGDKTGVVTVTYPDGSKDTVNVKVNVNKLSDEYDVTGAQIEVNQNTPVTNDDLKTKVTATSKVGNVSGTDKIAKVEPKAQVSTAAYGETNIEATVTFKDGTTKDVTIPLKVKDVTNPTIQVPTNGQNWDLIAVEGQDLNIAVTSEDNTGGSGVKTTTVTGLPDFLAYDEATKTIKFKAGVTQVPSLPEGTDVQPHNVTIEVEDNAGNKTSAQVTITVKSMTTKYDATPNSEKQTVSYGVTPDAGVSIDKSGLPTGTTYTWATVPSTTDGPGDKTGVVTVTYPDGSKDTVNVKVNVNKLSDEYDVAGAQIEVNQNTPVTNDDLKTKVTATSKVGNVSGTDKISTVVPKSPISTANYGDQNISAVVTFKDGTTKDVTIPLKVKDVTNPTIQAPTNGQNLDLIAVEGQDPNIAVTSEDNTGGSGVKTTTVTGLPDFLAYDEATKTIKFKAGVTQVPSLPEGTDVQPHNVTIEVEDNAGNKTPINVTITVKSMTTKYDATPNSEKQTVSYGVTPDAGVSIDKSGLPTGTTYTWATVPSTTDGPGDKTGVVTVTYPDGSKDTVNVKVNVNKLSDEYDVAGAQIEVNQNTPVTNDDLKTKVTATSKVGNVSGTDKISTVVPKSPISTANYGDQNISAVVTFKDGTTKDVTIPLKVKDVTNPTIQSPTNGQNWDLIAVEGQDPNIAVTSEDNAGGSGVKTTTVTGLPDFLAYDEATKTIKFKAGVTQVPSLPEGTDVQPHNVTIEVEDNAGNKTSAQVTITVKSMTTKYDATPNSEKQTVSYGVTPDAGTSVDKTNLPEGTSYAWKTTPDTNTPGEKDGVVEVTYRDGSKDTVNVKVNVNKLSDEYDVAGAQIEVNQNTPVTNDDLKTKVTATSKVGNVSGTDKISTVVPKSPISTANYGDQNISAVVTFKDGTTKDVTIPLKVKDVTNPTIQSPTNGQNWDLIAVEGQDLNIAVTSEDNTGGSGVKTTTVTGLPDFLAYDEATKTIKFKAGVTQVPSLPEGTDVQPHNVTIEVEDNAGNKTSAQVTITVKSMTTKYDATPNSEKQTVSYGVTPDAGVSIDKSGLPTGTTYTWATVPSTTDGPGDKTGVVTVTYPDGSKDTVNVKVNVNKLSDEYDVAGAQIEVNQNTPVTNDDLKTKVTATSKVGNVSGTDKISTVVPKSPISTANYGDQNISAVVTFKDGTTKDVTIPLKVKDVTNPTIQAPTNGQNLDLIAVEGQDPNIAVTSEDNTGGSGVKTTTVTGLPDFLAYDEATKTIKFKAGVTQVPSLPEGTDVQPHNVTIEVEDNAGNKTPINVTITVKSMTTKYDATPNSEKQTVSYGVTPDAGVSIDKSGLPTGTTYTWATVPSTTDGPGDKTGVVTVTYPDGSKDTVNVKVNVNKLSDEYDVAGAQIEVNQNTPVTNDDLKTKVTATSKVGNVSGTDKISTVVPKSPISTANYGDQNISAVVTFKDGTTKDVTIPLKVKDVTNPTIQSPTNGQNWDLIAVEGQDPNIAVTSEDNAGGSGVKTTTVTGLPDFLAYDEATKTIKFKAGVTQVPSLPEGTDVQPHNVTIEVEDNAGNKTSAQVTITVKSMTTKYDATPNSEKQTVSYGVTPDAGTSVDKTNLPEGTSYAWKTTPDTNTPGEKDGVVEVTYRDGSKDTVNVKVNVNKLSDEYDVAGAQIEVNQNTPVTNDDLKTKVTATSKVGNVSGTDKISTVVPKSPISTANYGDQNISAVVTFKDGTTKDVTIPLKVKDVTNPTIQSPTNGQNWDLIAVEGQDPNIAVTSEDNTGGSGVKTTTVTGLPDFLAYDEATKTIKFKAGVTQVPSLPEGTDVQPHNVTIEVEDNAGNKTSAQVTITVKSMTTKYDATPNSEKQTVSYGATPDAGVSIDKSGLPTGTTYTWATVPSTTDGPGDKTGVVTVTYPDGSKDTVNVKVNVNKLSDEYDVTGAQIEVNQNTPVTNDDLKTKVTATSKVGNVSGTDKIAKVEPKAQVSTAAYGETNIEATVTFKDGTTKDVTIPLKVKDVTNPTIQSPTNGQNWDLIAVEGQDLNIAVTSEDNTGGSGVKTTTVTGLPDFLAYDEATKTIKFKAGVTQVPSLPEGTDVQPHNVTIEVEDNAGNKTPINVTITVKSMTTKYDATPNSEKQTVSYGVTPDAGVSIDKSGLPTGTTYTWATVPSTTDGPGDKTGVVTVTYPDGSKDTVNVKVNVNKLSDEYDVAGAQIEVNQNTPVTNDDLKTKVTATSKVGNVSGTDKISTVVPKSPISTANYGDQNISAVVTFKDGTTKDVTIPLKVKDVTNPTIQSPTNGQNWDLIAVEGQDPNIAVTSEDNAGGSGVKTTTVTGLPDFLAYDEATKTIKFKAGVTQVPSLPEGTDVQPHNVTIEVEDNAGNKTSAQVTITVKSMTTKYDATPNSEKQTVSYGVTPDAGTSVDKTNLPEGTSYAWKTTPDTNTPGEKDGVVEVTYRDGSKDTVNVKVNVNKLSDEYDVAGAQIEVNQNTPVTNDDLKTKVTATSKVGNVSGTDKISTVVPKSPISTANYGDQNISAVVTFKDGTTKDVTIPLKVKDVTNPTIQSPTNGQNWDLIAVEGQDPNIAVTSEDNTGGSGVKTTTVTGLPDFLAYDEATKTIKFKAGVTQVPSLPEGTDVQPHNVTIEVEDNAGNKTSAQVTITVKSMTTKYDATPNSEKQTVSYGVTPDAGTSVDKTNLPEGTSYAWKTTPDTNTPGEKDGVVEVTYRDGSKDTVNVKVNVNKLSDEYNVTATEIEVNQNTPVTNDDLKAKVTATSKVGNVSGTDKIAKVEPKAQVSTAAYGETNIEATVTFKDGTTKDVTIPLKVKDVTNPTIQAPTNGQNWDLIAVEGQDPNIAVTSEDNTGGSGVKTTTVTGLPDFLAYDEATKTIKFKAGVTQVPSLPEGTDVQPHNVTIEVEDNAGNKTSAQVTITVKSMTTKYDATPNSEKQTVSYGVTPDAGTSVDKTNLPEGTSYAWKTTPDTNTPGEKDGVVEVTYRDGSKDTVNVKVNVNKLSDEYDVAGAQIEVNQNTPVTNDDLKTKVTATSKVGNVSGTDKISTVVPKSPISTANYGDQNISAVVTFKDGTTKDVTIPLKVKDVTNPTIQSPTNGQNWDLIAVEGQDPNIAVTSEDNAGGSGVKTTTVTGLPDFLAYDEATKTIKFKAGVTQVPSLPEGTDVQPHNVTIEVEDNAGNKTPINVTITVKSMTTKYDATPNSEKQTVSYGATPDAATSVNTSGLPGGTSYAWKTTPDTNTPGEKDGVVEVTYRDGSKDTVNVKVNVNKLSDEYDVTGAQIEVNQNTPVTNDDLKAKVTATSKVGNVSGTDKIAKVEPKAQVSTAAYGETNIEATVTFKDGTTKDVTIPLKVKDVTNPTIQSPTNGQNWDLIAVEGQDPNIAVTSEDNAGGSGVKTTTVTGLPDFLAYDEATKTIKFKAGVTQVPSLPEGTDVQPHNVTIEVEDNAGNKTSAQVTITVKSMTTKYDATPNSEKQTVSYGVTPDAGVSIDKSGLPTGTTYTWATVPSTTDGPGDKTGVVTVTYPDGSKDTVNVKVNVNKLSDEYDVAGAQIEVNQNTPVTNDDLKTKVTATSKVGNVSGTDKISTVVPKSPISTANYGDQNISAVVTFKDGTTKDVTIPLKVKDVTNPTIQSPTNGQNWDLIAVEGQDPNIAVTSEDNAGGSGVKTTTVTGLPDFLAYDEATKTIKFKAGVTQVPSLPEGTDVQPHNVTIEVEDNAGNKTPINVTITVKSMTTKYDATPNSEKQTVSYGATPDAATSVNTSGLPEGTSYAWKTTPDTNTPGEKDGVVEVTYRDGSKDTVNVKVNVNKLSDEYDVAGAQIEVNQNTPVTNDDLKTKVTATSKVGNVSGTDKISTVVPKSPISTANYGDQNISAVVTFKDGTTKDVTIPLKVKDVTNPTIQVPTNGQNWDLIAVEGQDPNIAVTSEDNAGGSGVKTTTVTGLPDFLAYDEATKTIKFKAGVTQVPSLPEGTDVQPHNVTIEVEDNAGNKTSAQVTITVKSMTTKYDATPNSEKQTVSYGVTPDAATSVNTSGLPGGTSYAWKTTPDTNTPGEKDGVVEVTYRDGSKDTVNVKVNVNKLSDEYDVTGAQIEVNQNTPVTNDDLKAKVTATSKVGNVSGTDKIAKVEPKAQVSTAAYGETNIEATVTFKDGTTKDVTIPLKVKDVTNPTIQSPTNGQNWDLIAVEGQDPNIAVTSEDNAGGSGVKTTTVTGLPDFLAYDEATKTIKFKAGVTQVPSLPEGTDVQPHNVTIEVEDNAGNKTSAQVTITVKSMTTKYDATPNSEKQTVSYGATPDAGVSIDKSGLPTGTTYTWATVPSTTDGPGDKTGVVTVTYPDGSKDTVNVKVNVNKLSDEYDVTGAQIEVNQNTPVTNDDLKTKVTATSKVGNVSGTDKIAKVEPKAQVSTAAYGETNIEATVTFKDGTTKDVTIPLKVKDVTNPTIQSPTNGQNWDLIAVEGQDLNIAVTSEDNTGGSGVKTTTVTGLPDFLAYDEATKTIKFKAGVTQVPSLPEGTDVQPHNVTIEVEDNAGNKTSAQVTITVKSMTTKYDATPNSEKQTVSYGVTPDAGTSVDKTNLPEGTSYAWKTTPDTNTPGEKDGVVEVTYRDGSKDTVNVKVNVNKLSDEYNVTATEIEVNQNTPVTNDDLKAKVTATSKVGNVSGTDKIAKVEPKAQVSTAAYGETNIEATVTFKDGTTKDVTIPLKVKDVTDPTILTPAENTNWEMTALDKTLPVMKIEAEDNKNGSGIATIEVNNIPSFLTFDRSTGTIVFKEGVQEVPRIKDDNTMHGVTIIARDKTGNSISRLVNITVWSMRGKYDPQPKPQTVDNGAVPNAEDSVDKTGLPSGTTIVWKETPVVNTPGSHPAVALVTYPDGTVDEVTVPITVKEQKDTFNPTAKQPNSTAKHGGDPSAEGSVNTENLPKGTTYTWVEKPDTNTTPGSKSGKVLITYPDNSTEEVTVTVEVTPQKDDYDPQPQAQTITNGDIPNVKDSIGNVQELPDGTKIEWKDGIVPSTNVPGDVAAKITITYPDKTEDEVDVTIIVKKQTAKGDPEEQPELPEFSGGVNGDPEIQPELPEFSGGVNGDPEEQPELPEFSGGVNGDPEEQPNLPEFSGGVNGDPEEQPDLPEFNGGVNGDPEEQPKLPEFSGGVNGDPEEQPNLPEFNGGVNGDPEEQPKLPEFSGGVNGDPEEQPNLPEFNGEVNGDPEEQPNLPEFSGGVNGDPEIQPEVQKNKLIITRWIDENGNELKPTDVKAPEELGGKNGVFEHGEIEGYEFIKTEVSESGDVVTYIFRKRTNNVITNIQDTLTISRDIKSVKFNKFSKTPKRLANTGETQNNNEVAGLGLAIVGLFAAIKRRRNEEN